MWWVGERRIQNCKKCDYENNANELICVECKDDYILIDEEKNICYLKEQYINNKRYFLKDSFHLRTCSKKINKCEECEKINENIICEKCEDDYSLVNENNEKKCMKTDDIINSNEYYLDQENNEYFSCKDYNSIQNCKKCNNKNICELCEDGYTFIDDNVASCKNIE